MSPDEWFERVKNTALGAADSCATQAETYAKREHPWKNRSGNAEKGLFGYVVNNDNKVGFGVAHGALIDYGKWLETKNDGEWGVCKKAVEKFVPEFKKQFANALEKGSA